MAKSDWEGETDRAEYVATVEDGWQGKGFGVHFDFDPAVDRERPKEECEGVYRT